MITEKVVDLHIHSHYSRATSKNLRIEELYKWGKIKGIHLMGTGDFTHPAWLKELHEKLEPAEPGLYRLKEAYAAVQDKFIPESCKSNEIRFVLTVEISNIYVRYGRTRKVHSIVVVPDFKTAAEINKQLSKIGNLVVDGRPTLSLDSEKLLKLVVEITPDFLFIPAHAWTPWFSMFGSRSGFDSIEEAFGDHAKYIFAIETGLSSDPFMNWRLSQLDDITITSHSDAHSPQKLAREATLIKCPFNYFDMVDAIRKNDDRLIGTVEFFPQEGKYHFDGHRNCGIRLDPIESEKLKGICPQCHRPLTIGVKNRVNKLANRPPHFIPKQHKAVEYIIPLIEVLAETKGVKGTTSKTAVNEYDKVISTLGDEFSILRYIPVSDIKEQGFPILAKAIQKMRTKDVVIEPGYDGVYGTVSIFTEQEKQAQRNSQLSLI